jgi:peptide/nickel transport system substrate-binding protein
MSDASLGDARYNGVAPMHQWTYSPFARDPFYIYQFWYRKHGLNQWPLCVWWSGPGADQVDSLTAQWKDSIDAAAKEPISKQIQQIIVDEVPYFLIYQNIYALPLRKNIKGFWYTPNEHLGYSFRKMTKE